MSYMVARMQKMKVDNLGGSYRHNERVFKNHSNKDIDTSKSHLNYELTDRDRSMSYEQQIKDYVNENKVSSRAIRKDAVLCDEWILTSDKQFFEKLDSEQTREFFETAKNYFAENYGESNIAYASVHLDESTPHMHLGVVPMQDGKLSSKAMFGREELRKIQDELPRYMNEHGFELERGELNSEAKHKTVAEFKKDMAIQEVEKELISKYGAPEYFNELEGVVVSPEEYRKAYETFKIKAEGFRVTEDDFRYFLEEELPVRETTLQEKMDWVKEEYGEQLSELEIANQREKKVLELTQQEKASVELEVSNLRSEKDYYEEIVNDQGQQFEALESEIELLRAQREEELQEIYILKSDKAKLLNDKATLVDETSKYGELLREQQYEIDKMNSKASNVRSELDKGRGDINTLESHKNALEIEIEALENERTQLAKENAGLKELKAMSESELGQIKPKKNLSGKETVVMSKEQFEEFKGLVYRNKVLAHHKGIELMQAKQQLHNGTTTNILQARLNAAKEESLGDNVTALKQENSALRNENSVLRQRQDKMLEKLKELMPAKTLNNFIAELKAIQPIIKIAKKLIEKGMSR